MPIGILCGASKTFNAMFNPLIQLFKPVSPLAWLPIVTMIVSAVYVTADPLFDKSFINSAVTVTLCSLWPTVINTAVGVASIDQRPAERRRGCCGSSGPRSSPSWCCLRRCRYIFTGMRLSLGVGWMVLIAAEMLAQNPGLGKFVWDEFQNGSSESLSRIMVAVFTIGIIGFLLDRVMLALQSAFTYGPDAMQSSRAAERRRRVTAARSACTNINLSIEEGEFVALIGFSGSGKTTLMSILAGLDPARCRRSASARRARRVPRARIAAWCSRAIR